MNVNTSTPTSGQTTQANVGIAQRIEFEESLLERAKRNERDALRIIFQQFISVDETIVFSEYMGQLGVILSVSRPGKG